MLPTGLRSTHAYTVYHLITKQPFRTHLTGGLLGASQARGSTTVGIQLRLPQAGLQILNVHSSPDKRFEWPVESGLDFQPHGLQNALFKCLFIRVLP